MKFTKLALIPVFLFLFIIASTQSYANQYEFFTDRVAFQAEYPDLKIQNFEQSKVAPSTSEACASPATSESNDNCFSPGDIMEGIQFVGGPPSPGNLILQGRNGVGINNPVDALVGNFNNQFAVEFNRELYTVVSLEIGCLGIQLGPCAQEVTVEVFGFIDMLGSTTVDATDSFQTFLGIIADEPIAAIRLIVDNPNFEITGVSEVRFGTMPRNVPTLSEWGLIATVVGLALIGFVVIRRRRKAYN